MGEQSVVTWTCHICKRERPDKFISVYSKDTSEEYKLPPGTMKMNVRYCNDSAECASKAPSYSHLKKEK